MNKPLSTFDPPSRPRQQREDFKSYFHQFEQWSDNYAQYVRNYLQQVTAFINGAGQGFAPANIPAAPDVIIASYLNIISGTATISNILAPSSFSGQIVLIAQDGFATDTAGNIASSIAVAAGQAAIFNFDPITELWYPVLSDSSGGGGFTYGTNVTEPGSYPYTVLPSDLLVMVDTSGGPRTINLPPAVLKFGIYIKDATGNGFVNNITIVPNGAETIDTSGTLVLANNYDAIFLVGTGIPGDEWAAI